MGEAFLYGNGGGTSLNFKVVGGTSAPSNPKENTIWVNTSTKITNYVFSSTQPSGVNGTVWFKTGSSCRTEFNALKKNAIQMYPYECYQYSGTAWTEVTAKCYYGGSWMDIGIPEFYIFKSGTGLMNGITGFSNASVNTSQIYNNYIEVGPNLGKSSTINAYSDKTVDVTDYKTAYFTGVTITATSGEANTMTSYVYVGSAKTAVGSSNVNGNATHASEKTVSVDISKLTGEVAVGISLTCNTGGSYKFSVRNIWLE
jgi:hypothetical protein